MTLLIDAAPLVALADPDEPRRDAILDALTTEHEALVIPAPTTAEIDYLLGQRFGPAARRAFLTDLAAGRFIVANLERDDYATVLDLEARYADLDLGLADCALITLADRPPHHADPDLRRATLPRRNATARQCLHAPAGRRLSRSRAPLAHARGPQAGPTKPRVRQNSIHDAGQRAAARFDRRMA